MNTGERLRRNLIKISKRKVVYGDDLKALLLVAYRASTLSDTNFPAWNNGPRAGEIGRAAQELNEALITLHAQINGTRVRRPIPKVTMKP